MAFKALLIPLFLLLLLFSCGPKSQAGSKPNDDAEKLAVEACDCITGIFKDAGIDLDKLSAEFETIKSKIDVPVEADWESKYPETYKMNNLSDGIEGGEIGEFQCLKKMEDKEKSLEAAMRTKFLEFFREHCPLGKIVTGALR